VTALLALFISLTGGVYAASKISGNKIKKESIAGKKLKNDGVTGQQVNESTLGKVPDAAHADMADSAQTAETAVTAQTAANAQTLAGTAPGGFVSSSNVKMFRYDQTVAEGSPDVAQDTLQLGPLTLGARCSRANDIFQISATSTAPGAGIDAGWAVDGNLPFVTGGGGVGDTPLVVAGAGGGNLSRRMIGNIIYNDPNTVIAIPFAVFYNAAADNANPAQTRCFFTGTATMTRA
jgi:hypothetical protein